MRQIIDNLMEKADELTEPCEPKERNEVGAGAIYIHNEGGNGFLIPSAIGPSIK